MKLRKNVYWLMFPVISILFFTSVAISQNVTSFSGDFIYIKKNPKNYQTLVRLPVENSPVQGLAICAGIINGIFNKKSLTKYDLFVVTEPEVNNENKYSNEKLKALLINETLPDPVLFLKVTIKPGSSKESLTTVKIEFIDANDQSLIGEAGFSLKIETNVKLYDVAVKFGEKYALDLRVLFPESIQIDPDFNIRLVWKEPPDPDGVEVMSLGGSKFFEIGDIIRKVNGQKVKSFFHLCRLWRAYMLVPMDMRKQMTCQVKRKNAVKDIYLGPPDVSDVLFTLYDSSKKYRTLIRLPLEENPYAKINMNLVASGFVLGLFKEDISRKFDFYVVPDYEFVTGGKVDEKKLEMLVKEENLPGPYLMMQFAVDYKGEIENNVPSNIELTVHVRFIDSENKKTVGEGRFKAKYVHQVADDYNTLGRKAGYNFRSYLKPILPESIFSFPEFEVALEWQEPPNPEGVRVAIADSKGLFSVDDIISEVDGVKVRDFFHLCRLWISYLSQPDDLRPQMTIKIKKISKEVEVSIGSPDKNAKSMKVDQELKKLLWIKSKAEKSD